MAFLKNIGQRNSSEHLNTFLGDGTTLSGEFSVSGSVRIDGHFTGKLSATGHLTIGQNGYVKAQNTIHCQSAHIAGTVEGNIIAPQKVFLTKTARIFGDITTQVLVIEEGAIFNGRSEMESTFDEQLIASDGG